jgi:cyclopropane fatty-acyl-phospholipid synthase-like methyltransferase
MTGIAPFWDERFATEGYLFGTEPNRFLVSQAHLLRPGMRVLAVADGEGRNGVWLASHGLRVHSVDAAGLAVAKAVRLAAQAGVEMSVEVADLTRYPWPEAAYDMVAAIFIQFAGPEDRARMFEGMKRALGPGGLLILQGYTPRQLEYRTGGPPHAENMYTRELLCDAFADMEILHLAEHDDVIREGTGHSGMSALIDLVARKRVDQRR